MTIEAAARLVELALGAVPKSILRQGLTQSGHEIFRIELGDQTPAVLRCSAKPRAFVHTQANLEALKKLGIPVQQVLTSGPTSAGGSFIVLSWTPGRDLLYELPAMTRPQITEVAKAVVEFQKRIATLPASTGFGWAPIGKNATVPRWTDIFGLPDNSPLPAGASPLDQLRYRLRQLRQSLESYFSTITPTCFLDDLTIKNVLVENGTLTGIIDVDYACFGDPLMSVGTTLALLAPDVGDAGEFYGQELLRLWNPSAYGRRAVQFYAGLWLIGMINAAEKAGDLSRLNQLIPLADAMLPPIDRNLRMLDEATGRHRAGDLPGARRGYQQVLLAEPANHLAQFRLGLLELQEGNTQAALELIEKSASAVPTEIRYQLGAGEALNRLGRWESAAATYRRAVAIDPRSTDAYLGLGVALQSLGDFPGAKQTYESTIAIQPDCAAALANLGIVLQKLDQLPAGIDLLRKAVAIEPKVPSHAINLGAALLQNREFTEAAHALEGAVELAPDNAAAKYNLANALLGLGRLNEAASLYEKAIALQPDYTDAWNNLGNIRKALGEFRQALAAYESAIAISPDSVITINNTGCLLRTLGRMDEAEAMLRRGLAIEPNHAVIWDNLGSVLKDSGRLDEAISCYRKSLALNPQSAGTHSNLAYALSFLEPEHTAILEECRRWNAMHARPLAAQIASHPNDRAPDRRLRIGYVSPDFREHCQSLFTLSLLSNHDRARFEIHCYSMVERPDDRTRQIAALADVWHDVATLDDARLAGKIRADRIDILVDLTMHMAGARPLLFARKPAPVQVAWLAYPGTTGIDAIDYRFTDPRLDPPGFESHYSERTIHLPDTFWCYDPLASEPPVNELPALSRGYLTFGCLNNPCKLTDRTLALWAPVLKTLGTARLLLMAPPGSQREHLIRRLARFEIGSRRVEFVAFRPRGEYLRTYHQIDLGLDTFPYNGHTTSLDSYWMGVPVITRVGRTSVGRGGLSQLHHLNLTQLAAETDEQFASAAIVLASDLSKLSGLRQQLRGRLESSPLMDANRFARNIENAYRRVWADYCASQHTNIEH